MKLLEYRKKKLRKTNTPLDDFLFSDAKDDAYFVLSTIAINRFLDGYLDGPFLEDLFTIYQDGGWPCGMRSEQIVVFDPALVK